MNEKYLSISHPCSLSPSTGCSCVLCHHHRVLGPWPRGPTDRPLRCRTHLWDRGWDGQAVEPQLVCREDPRGAEDPNRGGDPRRDGKNHRDTGHHSCGLLRERQDLRVKPLQGQRGRFFFNMRTYSTLMGLDKSQQPCTGVELLPHKPLNWTLVSYHRDLGWCFWTSPCQTSNNLR